MINFRNFDLGNTDRSNSQIYVSFSSVSSVIDHEFNLQLFGNIFKKFILNNKAYAWKTRINLFLQ